MLIKKTEDLKMINELDVCCFNDEAYQLHTLQTMSETHHFYLFYNSESEIVGFLMLLDLKDEYEIIKIGIKKEHRKKGYAYQALKQFIDESKMNKIFLEVSQNNTPAISLYKKLGFVEISQRKKYYSDGSDALIMTYIRS